MRGRQREAYLMYKRIPSRDFAKIVDMEENSALLQSSTSPDTSSPSWRLSFPHVVVATITSFLFGYHMGVVNEPLESICVDLGFSGNALAEGLVVSTCLGGAFVGSLLSGWIADGVGRRRAFQLCALPMIIGASMSASTENLAGMLLGRLFVGTGMGLGPPVAALYVTEVSPAFVRGTYGSFIQIATCLGLIVALFIGIPVKEIAGWWRICFWMSTIPAAILLVAVMFCAESPHWLYKKGRTEEAETAFEKLLGGSHVKYAMAELSKSDRDGDSDIVKMSELLYGRHFRGSVIAMILMDKLGRRVLLLWSFFGMAISMALQVTAASAYVSGSGALYLSVGGMLLFVFTFALGAGPVPGLLLTEIFPSRIRAKAMAVCMSVHWVINFFVGLLFLQLLEQLGRQLLYSIFTTFCLVAVMFVKRNVVETKGKSLQEIEIALLPQD
ncbi:probable plastidic glucose transporter 2 isoform X2 [Juglans microcarpa x Juglans regia]|uniref:probable plastidic glucose transporter 2 isoform X2 n=1 Tax=Juglans microcarpa x Juglans regia TaxID=2249226 RepID=UPI001B7DA4FA|nr:probable plastidic glucose transporter 2 isoform X2 [Juglans microcarpa x Juglans regia]